MLKKWIKEYQKEFQKTQFWSQFLSFLLAIFAFLSVMSVWKFIYSEYGLNLPSDFGELFFIPSILHLGIGFIFAFRFILLFSKTEKCFLITQILWLIGFAIFISWWIYSIKSILDRQLFGLYPVYTLFMADSLFSFISLLYIFLRPTKLVINFVKVVFRLKSN